MFLQDDWKCARRWFPDLSVDHMAVARVVRYTQFGVYMKLNPLLPAHISPHTYPKPTLPLLHRHPLPFSNIPRILNLPLKLLQCPNLTPHKQPPNQPIQNARPEI